MSEWNAPLRGEGQGHKIHRIILTDANRWCHKWHATMSGGFGEGIGKLQKGMKKAPVKSHHAGGGWVCVGGGGGGGGVVGGVGGGGWWGGGGGGGGGGGVLWGVGGEGRSFVRDAARLAKCRQKVDRSVFDYQRQAKKSNHERRVVWRYRAKEPMK